MTAPLVAELDSPEALVAAASRARELGYAELDAYTPFSIPELDGVLPIRRTRVPAVALLAGLGGLVGSYLILWWTNAVNYPLDVGGRPLNSIPTHIPIMFETTILCAAFGTFAAVLLASRLPRLYDPIFDIDGFERTSVDRFWLVVRDVAPATSADTDELRGELARLGALSIRSLPGPDPVPEHGRSDATTERR